ncbi:hypothetical protein [Clostridium cadaveris]|uniref:hypothetical protein n=1 Tax=Clostridium cadaveris TaxID=1529 RepID=UPI0014592B1F|nr:hypothetical protein [Clostridium cadaveris]NME64788.1 hypothetical protein [Clostridium cadaveris]
MIKSKKIKTLLGILIVLAVLFEVFSLIVAPKRQYYLIYDWMIYVTNYLIIIALFLIIWNEKFRGIKAAVIAALIIANSTLMYFVGGVNLILSKSPDKSHEVILKEYKNMRFETVNLKRRAMIFGKKVETLIGSSNYKSIEKNTYKIQWLNNDSALFIYDMDGKNNLKNTMFTLGDRGYINYYYVMASIQGKWIDKDDDKSYFLNREKDVAYADGGSLRYYNNSKEEQFGLSSVIIPGDSMNSTLAISIDPSCELDENYQVVRGGSISIVEVTLKEAKVKTFFKE